jgi:hypothetical protein
MSGFESFIQHGRRYGVDAEFWQTAAAELGRGELRRLARGLDVQLPRKLVEVEDMPREPASGAGSGVDIRDSGPTGRTRASVDRSGLDEVRNRLCSECGLNPVALLSRTGICRRCQLRLGQRRSRARRSSGA